jgi:secreted PhoX family phosphatase
VGASREERARPRDGATEIHETFDGNDGIDTPIGSRARPVAHEPFAAVLAKRMRRRNFLGGLAATGFGLAAGSGMTGLAGAGRPDLPARTRTLLGLTPPSDSLTFTPVTDLTSDTVVVPPDYDAKTVIRWGDSLFAGTPDLDTSQVAAGVLTAAGAGALQAKRFGYNNDAVEFFGFDDASDNGVLCVNHEYVNQLLMFPDWDTPDRATWIASHPEGVEVMLAAHGISVVQVQRAGSGWRYLKTPLNRRITAKTSIEIAGPVRGHALMKTAGDPMGRNVLGTLNNCAGGTTPWGTYLSAEENFDQYFANYGAYLAGSPDPAVVDVHQRIQPPSGGSELGWELHDPRFDVGLHPKEAIRFGWVVELDPFDPSWKPKKRTALGRMKHENATTALAADNRCTVYMGDDARFEYLFKFITKNPYIEGNTEHNRKLLDQGTLYAARFNDDGTGQWLPLVYKAAGPLGPANGFNHQADVCLKARKAGDIVGATPMDRPEDVERNPVNGKVYLACTNNTSRTPATSPSTQNGRTVDRIVTIPNPRTSNGWGHIIEITEDDDDAGALTFTWDVFLLCGDPASGSGSYLTSLEDLDDLPLGANDTYFGGWVDPSLVSPLGSPDNVSFDNLGNLWIHTDGSQPTGGHDGSFAVPVQGPTRGWTRRFVSMPNNAECCGGEFTPDNETIFYAVQHPGDSGTVAAPGSHWPDGPGTLPRPSLVAVTKTSGDPRIGS